MDVKDEEKEQDNCRFVPQKIFYQHRKQLFDIIEKIITEKNDRTACSLEVLPCRKLFSTIGAFSIVFSLYNEYKEDSKAYNIQVIAKVSDSRDDKLMTERDNNIIINQIVDKKISPHFVLNFDYRICKNMCTFLPDDNKKHNNINWTDVKNGHCIISFKEMFHGDVFSDVLTFEHNVIMSLISQVIMGCMALYHKKFEQNDLHLGNVFYRHLLNDENTYFSYKIGDDTYLVKHCKFLFAIGDYGKLIDHRYSLREEETNYIFEDLLMFVRQLREKLGERDSRYENLLFFMTKLFERALFISKKNTGVLLSNIFRKIMEYCDTNDDYAIMRDIFKQNEFKGNKLVEKFDMDISL